MKEQMRHEHYLLKDLGFPLKIYGDREKVEAIVSMGNGLFSYETISCGEASLLEPAIRDYLASRRG